MFKAGDRVRYHSERGQLSYKLHEAEGIVTGARSKYETVINFDVHGEHVCFNDNLSLVKGGPIRTVTRREIVPGDYGPIRILASSKSNAVIQLLDSTGGKTTKAIAFTAEELREAAHLFNQLAEALEDKP